MKQFIVSIVIVIAPIIGLLAQTSTGPYEITGRIAGLEDGVKVMAGLFEMGKVLPGDTAVVWNGQFHIRGTVSEGPRYYNVIFLNEKYNTKCIRLLIAKEDKIQITAGRLDSIPHDFLDNYIQISGSKADFTYHRFLPIKEMFYQLVARMNIDFLFQERKDSAVLNPTFMEGVLAARHQATQAMYYVNLHQYGRDTEYLADAAIPYLTKLAGFYNELKHPAILKDIYNNLSEEARNSFHGKEMKEMVKLSVGQPFPDFTLPDQKGKIFSSKAFIAKNKVTIVHFWAANKFNRTEFENELKVLYKKYHDKGLNIVAVSSNDSSDAVSYHYYKKKLKQQPFPWALVADLKGAKGIVATLYKEYGELGSENITNVLIDANGKIIAWDAYGPELQYYLWKTFGE